MVPFKDVSAGDVEEVMEVILSNHSPHDCPLHLLTLFLSQLKIILGQFLDGQVDVGFSLRRQAGFAPNLLELVACLNRSFGDGLGVLLMLVDKEQKNLFLQRQPIP